MTASPTDDPASAERRIQELTKELSQARGELAEGREQQAATAGILAALSRSLADLRRVCAEIAANAARLCDAHDAAIFQVEGDLLRLVAHHGPISTPSTLALTREVSVGRAILDRRAIHVADLQAETDEYPEGSERARRDDVRTVLNVPLIPAGKTIGAILIRRTEARLFSDKQIALLQTFANQAVIAIENTRLFQAEQASKRELQESLEYQTAMSEVLGVISRSTFELQPVLEAVVESATRLCGAKRGHIFRFDGEYLRFAAAYGAWPGFTEYLKIHPSRPGRGGASERVALEGRTVHIADVLLDSEYERLDLFSEQGYRTVLAVPMLREGTLLGVIAILKTHVEPFTEKQIALVETFADQAVIAIENTRLFEAEQASKRELQESLQYQTATSEVLSVISRSKFELQPVLDTLVQSAVRLCQADRGFIWRLRGNVFQFAAGNKMAPEVANFALEHPPALDRSTAAGRSVLERRTIHIPDLREDPEYSWHGGQGERLGQYRTVLGVPLLRDGKPFGAFALLRGAPKPFSDKQIELVTTFADQAAIAIENTRLFEAEQASKLELQEALDYQTATSEVLNVISRSKFDLQPVLDSIAQTASGLCELADTAIMLREGNQLRTAAHYGSISTGGPWRRPSLWAE